ncbi:hypothetical protein SH661x_002574 [Planctomicrobium sp. SH661]|uniref:hypothetical protein n=1 Tax=Planctomicrobium sp. SH661 TaxID=3448124 RepID=UPI003F5C00D9
MVYVERCSTTFLAEEPSHGWQYPAPEIMSRHLASQSFFVFAHCVIDTKSLNRLHNAIVTLEAPHPDSHRLPSIAQSPWDLLDHFTELAEFTH